MKNLLKVFIVLITVFAFSESKAQISAGAGVVYGTSISNIGFSVNGKYEINEKWSAASTFTLFLKKDYVTWSALDLNANYQLTDMEKFGSLYALAGLNITFYKINIVYDLGAYGGPYNETASGSEAGLNLGLGLNIPFKEKLSIAPEIKYTIGGAHYLRIGAKAMYVF
jgi:hypothetical protein